MENDLDKMTMLKMISLAGGTTNTAKLKSAVILRKDPDTGQQDRVPVDLSKSPELEVARRPISKPMTFSLYPIQ